MSFCDAKNYILESIEKMLKDSNIEKLNEVVDLILNANNIFIYGVGRSGLVGKAFAIRLVQIGLKAHFIGETTTPIVQTGDLVIIISRTGETYSALQTANIVRRVGAKLVVVTENKGSKLAHAGNITLCFKLDTNIRKTNFAPLGTLFEDATLIFLDGLISELMLRKNETEDTMRARHSIWV